VIEPAVAVTASFDSFHAEVEAFGRSVRGSCGVVGEDLGSPLRESPAERDDLVDVVSEAPADGFVEEQRCFVGIVGEVDVSHRFLSVNRP